MKFAVRRAVLGDESILRELRLRALTDSPRAFSSSYEREVARTTEDWQKWMSPGVTFILEADDQPGGLVAGIRDTKEAFVVLLMAMWVHPELRGTGAADVLISSVKAWAIETGATQVRLNVVQDNERARRCYERAGFRVTGRQGIVQKSGDIEIEMAFELPPS
jgi:GNAT superfamily N-acetyltransferase